MLIPSIDLMGGKVVQLVQGARKALEFDDFVPWVDRFAKYPLVQLIDLDAALGRGNNRDVVRVIARRLPCQVGGGIRSVVEARAAFEAGAQRVIVGSSLISAGQIDTEFAREMATQLGADKLVFAADCRRGHVAIKGWTEATAITAEELMRKLESYCSAFLYTNIDTEGLLSGIPMAVIEALRKATARQLIAAGGIRSQQEIADLDALGVDAVVGMAIYKGMIPA